MDITARKVAEEQRQFLMQELSHRVKNTFAVVQAIAFQTLRGIDQTVIDALQSRLTENLGQRHRLMLSAWTPYGAAGATPEQIANDTGLPVHVVRPRAGELVKRGLFFEVGKRPGNLGCRVTAYSVVKPSEAA